MKPDIFYAPSTGGFYFSDMHSNIPADAVAITEDHHQALIEGNAKGGKIISGPNGPQIEEPAAPTAAELRASLIARIKREAERRIVTSVPIWRQLNDHRALLYQPKTSEAYKAAAQNGAAIDAIRAQSDKIEAIIATLDDTALAAFKPRDDAHWGIAAAAPISAAKPRSARAS